MTQITQNMFSCALVCVDVIAAISNRSVFVIRCPFVVQRTVSTQIYCVCVCFEESKRMRVCLSVRKCEKNWFCTGVCTHRPYLSVPSTLFLLKDMSQTWVGKFSRHRKTENMCYFPKQQICSQASYNLAFWHSKQQHQQTCMFHNNMLSLTKCERLCIFWHFVAVSKRSHTDALSPWSIFWTSL